MRLPEWLVERGVGETRAVLIESDRIIEARIELDGTVPAGTVLRCRVANAGTNGRNAVAFDADGTEYLLPRGCQGATEGSLVDLEVTREAIPGGEPWKRALARTTDKAPAPASLPAERFSGRRLAVPAASDQLRSIGWDDLLEEARTGLVRFAGGELRFSVTPAMTLIDVDGFLPPEQLAVEGAAEAARAIRRLDIGGSIGIDLPTSGSKTARQRAANAIDAVLRQPFERTAVNGFGFIQIVRPRSRPSLVELAADRSAFEARALLRRVGFEPPGPKRLVAHPNVIAVLTIRDEWTGALARQLGGSIELRADPTVPMSGGYAENV
jgi:ribonuclease G